MQIMRGYFVSIITTCLNGERYLRKYFESVRRQTFRDIELIFINDGSTDNTRKIASLYQSKLMQAGIKCIFINYDTNKGTSYAVNEALKLFTGKYLMFVDSDDIMYPGHIAEKIAFMEKNRDYAWAVCRTRKVDERGKELGVLSVKHFKDTENLFERFIRCKDVYFTPIGYIYRSECFIDSNPERDIFVSRVGQNWQLVLPMAYKYECAFIDKVLCDYTVRTDSSSHSERKRNKKDGGEARKTVLLETIKRVVPEPERVKYIKIIEGIYAK